jgi:hypothetical protein
LKRRLPVFATDSWWQKLAAACATHAKLGPASLVLYDVSTLYFETDAGDGFREPGFSNERRLEPQITIGLLTDAAGFPLMADAFEGNTAETTTMLPTIQAFMKAHQLRDVTIVADAGMVSAANQRAIEAAGLSFILGARIPEVPYVVADWRKTHPDQDFEDGQVFTQPWPAGGADKRRDQIIYYQYKADRAAAPCAGSMNRSPRRRRPSLARPRSNATGSCDCPVRRRASTARWRPRPERQVGVGRRRRLSRPGAACGGRAPRSGGSWGWPGRRGNARRVGPWRLGSRASLGAAGGRAVVGQSADVGDESAVADAEAEDEAFGICPAQRVVGGRAATVDIASRAQMLATAVAISSRRVAPSRIADWLIGSRPMFSPTHSEL